MQTMAGGDSLAVFRIILTMPKDLKITPVDSSKSAPNPEAFLATGAGSPIVLPTPAPEAAVPLIPAVSTSPNPPAAEPEQPNRPGLETPSPTPPQDPFSMLTSWVGQSTKRALRGLNVPGGVVLRLSSATGSQLSESLCFVPNAEVKDGQLMPFAQP